MARGIPPTMAGVLERLELERPKLVTSADLASMLEDEGIATPVAVFASRMRDRGWLLLPGGVASGSSCPPRWRDRTRAWTRSFP